MSTVDLRDAQKCLNGTQTTGIFVLPFEIRDTIWKLSMPDDNEMIVQAKSDHCPKHKYELEKHDCIISFSIVKQRTTVPAVLQLCAESRASIPLLNGGEQRGSKIWWNAACDKILFDFDFDPRCLEGRPVLCDRFAHLVVGISYGIFFSLKLSLQPDMHTVRVESQARGQLLKLVEKLPQLKTFSIAYPDMGENMQPTPMQDRVRAHLNNIRTLVSSGPVADFKAITQMWSWSSSINSYGVTRPDGVQILGPPLDAITFGPGAGRVYTRPFEFVTRPAHHLAQATTSHMWHLQEPSTEFNQWFGFLILDCYASLSHEFDHDCPFSRVCSLCRRPQADRHNHFIYPRLQRQWGH